MIKRSDILINYLFEGLLTYIISLPFLLFIEYLIFKYYKRKAVTIKLSHFIGWQLFACVIMVILYITNPGSLTDFTSTTNQAIFRMNLTIYSLGTTDQILNTLLFIPLGLLIPLLWKQKYPLINTVTSGFILSLLIEIFQIFNIRASDINDLCSNTFGTLLGYLIFFVIFRRITFFRINTNKKGQIIFGGAICHILLLVIFHFFIGSILIDYMLDTFYF